MAKVKIGNILNCVFNRGAISSVWSSSTAYTAGQYAVYQNYIYKCIKNATAGTLPTNATYWQKTNLASEITSLNSNLAKKITYFEKNIRNDIKIFDSSNHADYFDEYSFDLSSSDICIATLKIKINSSKSGSVYYMLSNYQQGNLNLLTGDNIFDIPIVFYNFTNFKILEFKQGGDSTLTLHCNNTSINSIRGVIIH